MLFVVGITIKGHQCMKENERGTAFLRTGSLGIGIMGYCGSKASCKARLQRDDFIHVLRQKIVKFGL
jgi:hypothetical protein